MRKNPLKRGYSRGTVSGNIAREMRRGKPQVQAVAMSLREAREAWKARYPKRPFPRHLRKNPVPPSSALQGKRADILQASRLYEDFTGHAAEYVEVLDKPVMPNVLVNIGDCDGILYTTVRDGKVERYIHQFSKKARPLFCVSPDGQSLWLLGGSYDFTERGIVDRT